MGKTSGKLLRSCFNSSLLQLNSNTYKNFPVKITKRVVFKQIGIKSHANYLPRLASLEMVINTQKHVNIKLCNNNKKGNVTCLNAFSYFSPRHSTSAMSGIDIEKIVKGR